MSTSVFRFFGLRENPFSINPNPHFLYLTPLTHAASQRLVDGIRDRKGLILLTGEVGTGKTLLLRRLLDWLGQQRMPTALIFNSHVDPDHLLDFILNDFGVACESPLKTEKLIALNDWLLERHRAGQIPVLIIDEAQGLPFQALEEIRLLLNLETSRQKLLQVVLAGQPELELKLKSHELRQLRQRIAVHCRTAALTRQETQAYIEARLQKADARDAIFQPEAATYVHAYSRGIPRVINLLCEHSLINACSEGSRIVSAEFVESAARECQLDQVDAVSRMLGSMPAFAAFDGGDPIFGRMSMADSEPAGVSPRLRVSHRPTASAAAESLTAAADHNETVRSVEAKTGEVPVTPAAALENAKLSSSSGRKPGRTEAAAATIAAASPIPKITVAPLKLEPLPAAERPDARKLSLPQHSEATARSHGTQPHRAHSPVVSLLQLWWRSFARDARSTGRQIGRMFREQAKEVRPYTQRVINTLEAVGSRARQFASDARLRESCRELATATYDRGRSAYYRASIWLKQHVATKSESRTAQAKRLKQHASASAKRNPNVAKLRHWLREPVNSQQRRNTKDVNLRARHQAQQ